jgi:hypothetical protein
MSVMMFSDGFKAFSSKSVIFVHYFYNFERFCLAARGPVFLPARLTEDKIKHKKNLSIRGKWKGNESK